METLQKKSLFWDTAKINPQKNEHFIVERILNFGDKEDFDWALKQYGKDAIEKNLLTAKSLSNKSLNFWCRFFNLKKELCLAKQLAKKQSAFWRK